MYVLSCHINSDLREDINYLYILKNIVYKLSIILRSSSYHLHLQYTMSVIMNKQIRFELLIRI